MPTQELSAAMDSLKDLSTQDLVDLIDLLEADLGADDIKRRRRGKKSLDVARSQAGEQLVATLYASADLDGDDLAMLVQVAQLVLHALQPVEGRIQRSDPDSGEVKPVAQGTVQAKRVRRKVIDPETKQPEWRWYGPYLYIRTYAGRGGRRKDESRLKNIYLGRQELAEIFTCLPPRSPNRQLLTKEILEGYENDTLDEVYKRWVALQGSSLKDVTPSEDLSIEERRSEIDDLLPEPDNDALARRGRPGSSAAERLLRVPEADLDDETGWISDDWQKRFGRAAASGYVFKVWIDGLRPQIWRRFSIPAGISFGTLHDIVQIVMGWENYHLYRFGVGDYAITPNAPGYGDRYPDEQIDSYLQRPGRQLLYEYDFGDLWVHTLALEKHLSRPVKAPRCTAGARACPPEDCGGPWIYDEFLHARKKRKGRVSPKWQHRIGSYWDADAFDKEQINQELEEYWQSVLEEQKAEVESEAKKSK